MSAIQGQAVNHEYSYSALAGHLIKVRRPREVALRKSPDEDSSRRDRNLTRLVAHVKALMKARIGQQR